MSCHTRLSVSKYLAREMDADNPPTAVVFTHLKSPPLPGFVRKNTLLGNY